MEKTAHQIAVQITLDAGVSSRHDLKTMGEVWKMLEKSYAIGLQDGRKRAVSGAAEGWEPGDLPVYSTVTGTDHEYLRGQLEAIANGFYDKYMTLEEREEDGAEFSDIMERVYLDIRAEVYTNAGIPDPSLKTFKPENSSISYFEELYQALRDGRLDDALDYAKATVGFEE